MEKSGLWTTKIWHYKKQPCDDVTHETWPECVIWCDKAAMVEVCVVLSLSDLKGCWVTRWSVVKEQQPLMFYLRPSLWQAARPAACLSAGLSVTSHSDFQNLLSKERKKSVHTDLRFHFDCFMSEHTECDGYAHHVLCPGYQHCSGASHRGCRGDRGADRDREDQRWDGLHWPWKDPATTETRPVWRTAV